MMAIGVDRLGLPQAQGKVLAHMLYRRLLPLVG